MRKDRFTDEALRNAYALADLKYSENPEDQVAFEEAYDFARCQRPDGSFYGTSGQCRKGKDAGAKAEEPKKAARGGQAKTALQAEQDRQNAARANRPAPKPGSPAAKAIEAAREDLRKERGVPKPGSPAAKAIEAAREDLRKERGAPKPGSPAAKAIEAAREDLRKERGAPKPGSPAAKAIEAAKQDIKAEREASKPKKLKTDFRKDVEKGAAKRKAADEKRATRMARDNELRGQIREGMAALKPVKAELDRRERAMKEVERRIKKDPSKENRANLRTLQRAVREQDRAVRAAEREIEKMAKERLRISKQNERERMTPAQRAEAARIRKIIKERG